MEKFIKKRLKEKNSVYEFINYLIVGIITLLVTLAVFCLSIMTFLDSSDLIQLQIANIFSWVVAVIFSFFANRIFVFKSDNDNIMYEAYAFFVSRFGTLVIDMALMYVFVSAIGFDDFLSKVFVQAVVIIINFLVGKFWVFK